MAKSLVPVCLLLVSALCLRVQAVTQIVAFGDSLTDDCTHGAKQVVDAALGTTAVPLLSALSAALALCAVLSQVQRPFFDNASMA